MHDSTIATLLRLDAAGSAMGVRRLPSADSSALFEQSVLPALADHRGRIGLAMFSVLLDSALGSGAYRGHGTSPLSVVASMSVALTGLQPQTSTVYAEGSSVHIDAPSGTALARAEVRDGGGAVMATATARAASVDRSFITEGAEPSASLPDVSVQHSSCPADVDGLSHLRSLTGSIHGVGGLVSTYGLEITELGFGRVVARFAPMPWMLNPLGSVQGGVLAGLLALGTELAGQAVTGPGQNYALVDIGIDLVKSPTLIMGPLTLRCSPARSGRRFCLLDTTLRTEDGTLIARSHGTVLTT
ncbi:MAG: hotdog fold thioesterase [Rhodococcus fascians]